MKGIDYLLNIFRILRCKLQSIPAKISPILPVLNNGIDGMSAPPVLGSYVQNLPSGPIAFLALPVAVSPFGEKRRVSGQLPVFPDDFICLRAVHHTVVNATGNL